MSKQVRSGVPGRGFSWLIASLLLLCLFISYVDRQTLSVLVRYLPSDMQMSSITYGKIESYFLLSYALALPFAGWFIDRLGTRAGLAWTVGIFSIFEFLQGTARNVTTLGTYILLLGIPEAAGFPAAGKVAAEHAEPHAKATLMGIAMLGVGLGTTLTPPVAAFITLRMGWSWVFYANALAGLAWLIFWLMFYHPQPKAVSAAAVQEVRTPWIKLLADSRVLGLMATRLFSDSIWWFYLFWIPPFLNQQVGLDLHHMGLVGWIPYFFAGIGSAIGGYASGYLVRRKWAPLQARRAIMWVSACVVPLTTFVAMTKSVVMVITLLAIATFFIQAFFANVFTIPADLFEQNKVASVVGLNVMCGSLAGSLSIWVAGHIVQRFSYMPVFVMMAFFLPAGALCAQKLIRSDVPVQDKMPAPSI